MSGVPSPRAGYEEAAGSPGFRMLYSALTDIRTDLRVVMARMDNLGRDFVPREEINSRFAASEADRVQLNTRVSALEGKRETDRQHLDDQIDKIEDRRVGDRRQIALALVGLTGPGLTALIFILAHWK